MENQSYKGYRKTHNISIGDTLKIQLINQDSIFTSNFKYGNKTKEEKVSVITIIGIQSSNSIPAYVEQGSVVLIIIVPKNQKAFTYIVGTSSEDKVSRCRMVLTEKCLSFTT